MEASHPYYSLANSLRDAAADTHGEVHVGLLVACLLDENLDEETAFSEWAHSLKDLEQVTSVTGLLSQLIGLGFGKEASFQATLQHSHLLWAWQERQGLPIALALIVIALARLSGLQARGVNYPGHFLVEVDGCLIDPLTMTEMPDSAAKTEGLHANAEAIALRMLNNLKAQAMMRSDFGEVLNLLDLQLYISSNSDAKATLHYEQAEVWVKFGSVTPALSALSKCIEMTSHEQLQAQAEKRLDQLQKRSETLH